MAVFHVFKTVQMVPNRAKHHIFSIKKKQKVVPWEQSAHYYMQTAPLDWNSPCRGEGASHQEVFTQVRQREELNWASQLKSSDQQIFSTMSSTYSSLIRQDWKGLLKLKHPSRCSDGPPICWQSI